MTLISRGHSPFDVLVRNFFGNELNFQPAEEAKIKHPVDIYETKDGLVIEVACTGISKEDIDISIAGNELRFSYDKDNDPIGETDHHYLYKGIAKRSFNLGYKIAPKFDLSKANAEMENGLLTLRIPLAKEAMPKTLKIK